MAPFLLVFRWSYFSLVLFFKLSFLIAQLLPNMVMSVISNTAFFFSGMPINALVTCFKLCTSIKAIQSNIGTKPAKRYILYLVGAVMILIA